MKSRYTTLRSRLKSIPDGQRIILRADANIPLQKNSLGNTYRLTSLLPTLTILKEKKSTVIFITHIGNPVKQDEKYSTTILIPWFLQNGFAARFAKTLHDAYHLSLEKKEEIIVLENSRFFPGEKQRDYCFAQEIAKCGDYFVFDAFATAHREDTSVALLPTLFKESHRTIGILVEQEITALSTLLQNMADVFILCGGSKLKTKLPLLKIFLSNGATVALFPALVFTFLKSAHKEVGLSLVDNHFLQEAQALLQESVFKDRIIFPQDYLIAEHTLHGALRIREESAFTRTDIGISIGPKTVASLKKKLNDTPYIFFNAAAGFTDRPETLRPVIEILHAMSTSKGWSAVGGGDSVERVFQAGVENTIDFISTGGGATLVFLACEKMPGLEPFLMQ